MTPDERESLRVLSDQRMNAWERVVSKWMADLLSRRMQSLRQRLEQVWTPQERAILRRENEDVGRRARLDTFIWPEYLRATQLPYSLEGKSEERDYLKDTDRWRETIEEEGSELFGRIFSRAEEAAKETLPGTDRSVSWPDDPLTITTPRQGESGGPSASLDADSLVQRDGVRSILNQRLQWALSSTENRVDQILDAVLAPENEGEPLKDVWDRVKGTTSQRMLWGRVAGNALAASTLNAALLESAAALGMQYKQWLSSRDDRVRWTHAIPLGDGQTVRLREAFSIGGIPLQYPGDPIAFAYGKRGMKQIYGCRCTLLVSADAELFADIPYPPFPGAPSPQESAREEQELQDAAGIIKVNPTEAVQHLMEVLKRSPGWTLPGGRWISIAARRLGVQRAMVSALAAALERWMVATALGDAVALGVAVQQVSTIASDIGLSAQEVDSIVGTLQQEQQTVTQ